MADNLEYEITDTIGDNVLDKEWNPTLEMIQHTLLEYYNAGKNIFKSSIYDNKQSIFSSKGLSSKESDKQLVVENKKEYAFSIWLREIYIIMQSIREFFTDTKIDYIIKVDKEILGKDTVTISAESFYKMLLQSRSEATTSVNIDTLINASLTDAMSWSLDEGQKEDYEIIDNRIKVMEKWYMFSTETENYKTWWLNENEKPVDFKARRAGKAWENAPLQEYQNQAIKNRYQLYLDSIKDDEQIVVRTYNKGHITIKGIKRSQLYYETTDGTNYIGRLFANKGDLYEAAARGASYLVPKGLKAERESIQNRKPFTIYQYHISPHIRNIDNMIAKKTSTDFLKAGDINFEIKQIINKNIEHKIYQLQAKTQNSSIHVSTILNLFLKMVKIFNPEKGFTTKKGTIYKNFKKQVQNLLLESLSKRNYFGKQSELDREVIMELSKKIQEKFDNIKVY